MDAKISGLHWYSDWNGDEVGFPNVDVVGLYGSDELGTDFYVNSENGEVLAVMVRDIEE